MAAIWVCAAGFVFLWLSSTFADNAPPAGDFQLDLYLKGPFTKILGFDATTQTFQATLPTQSADSSLTLSLKSINTGAVVFSQTFDHVAFVIDSGFALSDASASGRKGDKKLVKNDTLSGSIYTADANGNSVDPPQRDNVFELVDTTNPSNPISLFQGSFNSGSFAGTYLGGTFAIQSADTEGTVLGVDPNTTNLHLAPTNALLQGLHIAPPAGKMDILAGQSTFSANVNDPNLSITATDTSGGHPYTGLGYPIFPITLGGANPSSTQVDIGTIVRIVPEPAMMLAWLGGLVLVGVVSRRRRTPRS